MADGMADLGAGEAEPMGRMLADQLFSRVAGASLIEGNQVRLLHDGRENYPAWLDAIRQARRQVHFENYIFRADPISRSFAEALAERARAGVRVRVLLDWLGSTRQVSRAIRRQLREAGVELRFFNPPRLDSPFGWLSRNHRKSIACDGEVGFVAGLCIGQMWVGDPAHGLAAWRDTGIEIRGPAVAELDAAFAASWAHAAPKGAAPKEAGPKLADEGGPTAGAGPGAGTVALRVIGSRPNGFGLYRLDQIVAALARRSLWLTDAYFVGTTAYVRALCDAARDGVDVRLLVPGASDLPVTRALSRAGYRPLLQAGIRVYEWNGPMLHAKTAVADGRWARIGSSNLNLASWIGNWELDVAIEDRGFAGEMEATFLDDLENATEIVLDLGRVHRAAPRPQQNRRRGSPGRIAAGAVGIGSAVGAAITNHRALGPAEAKVMAASGVALAGLAAVAVLLPRLLTLPLAGFAAWIAAALLLRAWRLRRADTPAADPRADGGNERCEDRA